MEDRSKVPGIISNPTKQNKYGKHYVSKSTLIRLEKMSKQKNHVQITKDSGPTKAGEFDIWDEESKKQTFKIKIF